MSEDTRQWWLATVGELLVWARLEVLDSGLAQVLDSNGETLRYDDETTARMALLDAEFRAFDGLDAEDAEMLGVDLEEIEPPRGDSDEDIVPQMIEKLPPRA